MFTLQVTGYIDTLCGNLAGKYSLDCCPERKEYSYNSSPNHSGYVSRLLPLDV